MAARPLRTESASEEAQEQQQVQEPQESPEVIEQRPNQLLSAADWARRQERLHILTIKPPTKKKNDLKLACIECRVQGRRVECRTICQECIPQHGFCSMVCLQEHHRREKIFQSSQDNQRESIEDASSHAPSRSPYSSPQHYPSVPENSPALQDENSSALQDELPDANTFVRGRSSDESLQTHMDPTNDWMDEVPTSPVQETTPLDLSSADRRSPKEPYKDTDEGNRRSPKAPYPYQDTSEDGDSNLPLRPSTSENVKDIVKKEEYGQAL